MDEFEIDKLIERGLAFDEELRYSEDFVAISRYEGAYWKTIWLNCNETFAWHSNSDPEQKKRAIEIGEVMTLDQIQELSDQGINVFQTIKKST